MKSWEDSFTMDDLKEMFELCKPPPGPRIDERTKLYAGLDAFALNGDAIKRIEEQTKKDVLWNAAFDSWDEDKICILNPPELKLPYAELEMKRPPDFWRMRLTMPIMLTNPMIGCKVP